MERVAVQNLERRPQDTYDRSKGVKSFSGSDGGEMVHT